MLWAKRIAVWSNLTITKAVESKTKLKINNSPSLSQLAGFYVDLCNMQLWDYLAIIINRKHIT